MTSRRNNQRPFDEETLKALKAEHEVPRARRSSADGEEKEETLSQSSRTSSTTSSSVASDLSSQTDCGTNMEITDAKSGIIEAEVVPCEPFNFALVVPGVYRSSYPQTEHHQYLKSLGLKTIITLVNKEFPEGFKAFMQENGIRHCLINVEATKRADIPESTLHAILNIVLDPVCQPVLIHCNHGKHRTGCVVAAIRHWQNWPCQRIVDEYKRFAEPKARLGDLQYITNFDVTSLAAITASTGESSSPISEIAKGFGETGRGRINRRSLRLLFVVTTVLAIWILTINRFLE